MSPLVHKKYTKWATESRKWITINESSKVEDEWLDTTVYSCKGHIRNSFNPVECRSKSSNALRLRSLHTIHRRHKGIAHQTTPTPHLTILLFLHTNTSRIWWGITHCRKPMTIVHWHNDNWGKDHQPSP